MNLDFLGLWGEDLLLGLLDFEYKFNVKRLFLKVFIKEEIEIVCRRVVWGYGNINVNNGNKLNIGNVRVLFLFIL